MRLGLVTDELSLDPETAIELAASWGIGCFELRKVFADRCPDFGDQAMQAIAKSLQRTGGRITALSPGLFKLPLRSAQMDDHRGDRLQRTLALAERLGVPHVITFGVERAPDDRPADYARVVDRLGEAAEQAGRRGFTLLLESEPGFWADTAANTLQILKDVSHRGLLLNFDPANMAAAGDTDAVADCSLLLPYIGNVHVKDLIRRPDGTRAWAPLGAGILDWQGLLAALQAGGYDGVLSLETHVSPRIAATSQSLSYLLRAAEDCEVLLEQRR